MVNECATRRRPTPTSTQPEPTIALLSCHYLFEDFFDTIGISLETLRTELTGGWMFNYIEALQLVGVRTVLFFISARISETLSFTHAPTGAGVCVLPSTVRTHRLSFLKGVGVTKLLASYQLVPLGLLARELRREGCDVILCQDYEYPSFDACVLLGQLMGLPVFATFQGGGPQSRWERPLRWLALQACTGLLIATQTEIQRVRARYGVPSAKLARIFNPTKVTTGGAIDRNEARAALGIPLAARMVVYHGRIDIHQKGLDILLDAWERLCRDRPGKDLRLLLVGTGSDANELRSRLARMRLRGVLWIDEYVRDRLAIQRYLCAADVYTLPSRHEGFPVAPLEAMACGLPVVAADAPGVRDILELGEASGGLVVPREDATALCTALGRVLDDEAWGRELGQRAQCRIQECFSLSAIGKQLRDFLFQPR